MGFSSEWLEKSYLNWRHSASARLIRLVLFITSASAFLRCLGHVPGWDAINPAIVLGMSTVSILLHVTGTIGPPVFQYAAAATLCADFVLQLPGIEAIFPAVLAVFSIYTFFSLPFWMCLTVATTVSIVQTCSFLLFVDPLHTNELLAIIVIHIWTNFTGIYLCSTSDRLARNAFLSARNSAEAETAADFQSNRLNHLLASFLPPHLITQARHQITLYTPHLYNENYSQVSVCYGRLIGFESVLAQCSPIDAARVLKELDVRIDRLAASNGCTRVASEGITAVCSIPGIDSQHASKLCRFALELECLIRSFSDATGADVSVCIGIDSGSITGGIVGTTKWHYDVIGPTVDNALLMQSNATKSGVYVSNETRRFIGPEGGFELEKCAIGWRLQGSMMSPELFPINKRFSMVTVPQAINRVLQSVVAMNPTLKTIGTNKKRKSEKEKGGAENFDMKKTKSEHATIISPISQKFRSQGLEDEFHKETDHWFIPSLAISIFFLVIYGIYHMLVMPRLITSLALIVVALTLMFFILLMLYIDYFHSFSQFITRTSAGHAVTILLIITVLFICGIVNTFSCPQPNALDVCQKSHFSTYSFAMWTITTGVFIRFPSIYLAILLLISLATYGLQIFATRPNGGALTPREFIAELDLTCHLIALVGAVLVHQRRCEKLLRLDFLAVVKGVEETASRDKIQQLNQQMMLNLVPAHVAPGVVQKSGDLWHHSHQSVGIAYIAVSGFDLEGENGINGLNYIFSHFDQQISQYKGVEKVKSANRFYIVAVGLVPDAAQNVNETPWTIGELLSTLAHYLISLSQFAVDNDFHVQIGVDCGTTLALVSNTDCPRYELFGETLERSRILMQAAGHDVTLVSEDVYLALRPRPLRFSPQSLKVTPELTAYELMTSSSSTDDDELEERRHTRVMVDAQLNNTRVYDTQTSEMASSMTSFSSELGDGDDDAAAETDTDLEWITPETALMHQEQQMMQQQRRRRPPSRNKYVMRQSDYDPYREPIHPNMRAMSTEDYMADYRMRRLRSASDLSDADAEYGRGGRQRSTSRSSYRRGWRAASKNSLRNGFGLFRRSSSQAEGGGDAASLASSCDHIEAAATRVDRMIQELNAYGDFADVKPLEYQPFPASAAAAAAAATAGSLRSVNRAMSSACHTEYDNAESDAILSDLDDDENFAASAAANANYRNATSQSSQKRRWQPPPPPRRLADGGSSPRWRRDAADGDTESQCSSMTGSIDLDPIRWKSVHSIGYENEYEMPSDTEGLALEEMVALSRDIRNNFGDFQLATFDDVQHEQQT